MNLFLLMKEFLTFYILKRQNMTAFTIKEKKENHHENEKK